MSKDIQTNSEKKPPYSPLASQAAIGRENLDTETLEYPKLYEYLHEKLYKGDIPCGLPDDIDMDMPQFLCGFIAAYQTCNGYVLINVNDDELSQEVKSEIDTLIEYIKENGEDHKYYSNKDHTEYVTVYGGFNEDPVYLFEHFNGDTHQYLMFPAIDFNPEVWFTGDNPEM